MSRKTKISADISEEAALLLADLVVKHERSRGWLLDKMIRKFCEPQEEVKKVTKSKTSYPSNLDEQFEQLWIAKGRKGSKKNAKAKFKQFMANASSENCEEITEGMIADIQNKSEELGMTELHLTTYLNQERWEQ